MKNIDKVKNMNTDEMADFLKQVVYNLLKKTATIVNGWIGEETPDVPIEEFDYLQKDFKEWLEAESE